MLLKKNNVHSYIARITVLLLQLNHCNCPGQNLVYECTVCGEGATVWTGSLFECPNGQILLRHREFRDDWPIGECCSSNGVLITAQSIGPGEPDIHTWSDGFCYTSQLRLQNVTISDNNKTIACHHNDGNSVRVIDNDTLVLTTGELIHIALHWPCYTLPILYITYRAIPTP